jgi:hypothetical protein
MRMMKRQDKGETYGMVYHSLYLSICMTGLGLG